MGTPQQRIGLFLDRRILFRLPVFLGAAEEKSPLLLPLFRWCNGRTAPLLCLDESYSYPSGGDALRLLFRRTGATDAMPNALVPVNCVLLFVIKCRLGNINRIILRTYDLAGFQTM